jgi:predicted transcriptional regulator
LSEDITIDELLAELHKVEMPNGSGMTTHEISNALNMSEAAVRRLLKRGIKEGRIINEQELRSNPFRGGRRYSANVFRVRGDGDAEKETSTEIGEA